MSESKESKKSSSMKQQVFVDIYCSNGFNATQAAVSAGYSEKTAASQGQRLLKNVEISNSIRERLDHLSLTAEELTKRTADIARGNLADYMTTRMISSVPTVRKGLQELIEELEYKLLLKEEFCAEKGYTEEQYDEFQSSLEPLRDQILSYRIELRNNPDATRLVDGEAELVPHVEIDMTKLVADKERGVIKSFKYGKNGLEVELYPADAAIDRLMRVRGMYKDKLDITTNEEPIHSRVSPEEAARLLAEFQKGNFNIE